MSIKPVDFQISVPRTLEASRVSSDAMQRNVSVQQQQALQTQHKTEKNLKQVYSKDKAEEVKIREKQSRQEKKEGRHKRDSNSSNEIEEKNNKQQLKKGLQDNQATTIDIRL